MWYIFNFFKKYHSHGSLQLENYWQALHQYWADTISDRPHFIYHITFINPKLCTLGFPKWLPCATSDESFETEMSFLDCVIIQAGFWVCMYGLSWSDIYSNTLTDKEKVFAYPHTQSDSFYCGDSSFVSFFFVMIFNDLSVVVGLVFSGLLIFCVCWRHFINSF